MLIRIKRENTNAKDMQNRKGKENKRQATRKTIFAARCVCGDGECNVNEDGLGQVEHLLCQESHST